MTDMLTFQNAFEGFLRIMTELDKPISKAASEAAEELCGLLRIAKLGLVFYENAKNEQLDKKLEFNFFDSEEADISGEITHRQLTQSSTVAIYTAYPYRGSEPWTDTEKQKIGLVLDMLYIFTSRGRLIEIINRLTFYDDDGYRNLRFFIVTIERLIQEKRLGGMAGVYYNLRHFSRVNQQIGRKSGTVVMHRFYDMLSRMIGDEGVISRVGGDNFVLITKADKLDYILDRLNSSYVIYNDETHGRTEVSATAGVYVLPKDCSGLFSSDVIDRLITASQIARSGNGGNVVFYSEAINTDKEKIMRVQGMFNDALKNEEFLVYYQPKVALGSGRLAGAEALCRWLHDGVLIQPGQFIPVLERSSDICRLDFYMLEHVCRDLRRWLDEGREPVRVSVNLSRKHMMDSDLLGTIIRIIDSCGIPHEYIEIELTETTTDVEFLNLKRVVSGLQAAGIYTSVDDFGIGYSSLKLIKEIPWNVLKVDKSFVPAEEDDDYRIRSVMFRHVVAMAQELGLECIAEGVETKAQVDILKENGCALAQGFYFDKPLPVKEFENRLDKKYYLTE